MLAQEIINRQIEKTLASLILLGSANLPFPRVLTSKSDMLDFNAAEATKSNRIFPDCEYIDHLEEYGCNLLRELLSIPNNYCISFNPLSGSQANQIVYNAILNVGDAVLSLSLASGGHSSHTDFLRKYYKVVHYNYSYQKDDIDYENIYELCKTHKPKLVIAGASSFPLAIKYDLLKSICEETGALLLADISHNVIYMMSNIHTNPVHYADFITFTTHKTTRGPRGAMLLYNNKFKKEIEYSIFPLSQGAPIASMILKKVIMLEELTKIDILEYSNRNIMYARLFSQKLQERNYEIWPDKTDCHLSILKTSDSKKVQNVLSNNNILVTSCLAPYTHSPVGEAIRFGFMTAATLEVSLDDFNQLIEIVISILENPSFSKKEEIERIIYKYNKKYFNMVEGFLCTNELC